MVMKDEGWKAIPGYEGYYEVSSEGRVRSLDRLTGHNYGGRRITKGRILAQSTLPGGYKIVRLARETISRNWRVPRLVLMAFAGIPDEGMAACHFDGNPENNALSNLRWDTYAGNESDKARHGTDNAGDRSHFAILTSEKAGAIKRGLSSGARGVDLAREFNVSQSTITAIKKGRAWASV
jgi:hypothetical protein